MITIYKNYVELTLISNVGISNNLLVRSLCSLGLAQLHQDKEILADSLITNDYLVSQDSTDQAITDILLKDKHKEINKQIENYINNI